MDCPVSHIRLQLSAGQEYTQNAELNGGFCEDNWIAWKRVDTDGATLWRPWLLEYHLPSHCPLIELDFDKVNNSICLSLCLPTGATALGIKIRVECSDAVTAVHRSTPHPDNLSQQLKLEDDNAFIWHISNAGALAKYFLPLPSDVRVSELQLYCSIRNALASARYVLSYEIKSPPNAVSVSYTTTVFVKKAFR
jgi:hypothetical protein